jgi:hypothetical protein
MDEYYDKQVGSGLTSNFFVGRQNQKGHGFFGRIFKGGFIPLMQRVLPFLKDQAMEAGQDFFTGLSNGEDIKTSAKNMGKRRAASLIDMGTERLKRKIQTGKGKKRRRRRKAKAVPGRTASGQFIASGKRRKKNKGTAKGAAKRKPAKRGRKKRRNLKRKTQSPKDINESMNLF